MVPVQEGEEIGTSGLGAHIQPCISPSLALQQCFP